MFAYVRALRSVAKSGLTLCDPMDCQGPLSMGFSRKYWSGLLSPAPGDLSDPGIELMSPVFPALAGGFFTTEPPGKSTRVYWVAI